MDSVSQISSYGQGYQGANSGADGAVGGDYQTFLRMLTAQIQNQDPLNPMEGSDFAVQLATFSGVEQQALTNKLLTQLLEGASGAGLSELSSWIGKTVRSSADVSFVGEPVAVFVEPRLAADEAFLVAIDQYGREVSRKSIGPEVGDTVWTKADFGDVSVQKGTYRFRVESYKNGELIGTDPAGTYSRVVGAERVNGIGQLLIDGGAYVAPDDVSAVYG